jgi:hypothetical protein
MRPVAAQLLDVDGRFAFDACATARLSGVSL